MEPNKTFLQFLAWLFIFLASLALIAAIVLGEVTLRKHTSGEWYVTGYPYRASY